MLFLCTLLSTLGAFVSSRLSSHASSYSNGQIRLLNAVKERASLLATVQPTESSAVRAFSRVGDPTPPIMAAPSRPSYKKHNHSKSESSVNFWH